MLSSSFCCGEGEAEFGFSKKIGSFLLIFAYLLSFNLNIAPALAGPKAVALSNDIKPGFPTQLYISKKGDKLATLAERYNLSISQLLALNEKAPLYHKPYQSLAFGVKIILPQYPLSKEEHDDFQRQINLKLLGPASNEPPAKVLIETVNDSAKDSKDSEQSPIMSELAKATAISNDGKNLVSNIGFMAAQRALAAATRSFAAWANKYSTSQISVNLLNGYKPASASFDLLFPLYDKPNLLLFNQSSFAFDRQGARFNIGIGNRYFLPHMAWGANTFFDYDITNGNMRAGIGGEYWQDYLQLAVNSYYGLSGWQSSRQLFNHMHYKMRPAPGFDMHLRAYLPFYPQIGFNGAIEKYFGENIALYNGKSLAKSPLGFSLGVNYSPLPLVNLELAYQHQGAVKQASLGAKLIYHFGLSLAQQLDSSELGNLRQLNGMRYGFVERNKQIVLDYRKDIPIILKNISGPAGTSTDLVEKVKLGRDWSFKEWEKNSNIQLSKDCYDSNSLARCRVTLPAYNRHNGNDYVITIILVNNKSQQEQRFFSKLCVIDDHEQNGFTAEFAQQGQFNGAPKAQFLVFNKLALGANWQIAGWQYKKLNGSAGAWGDAKAILNDSCFNKKELAQCSLTLPDSRDRLEQYKLRLVAENNILKAQKIIEADLTVEPIGNLIEQKAKIIAQEGQAVNLFSKAKLSPFWQLKWHVPQEFSQAGGKLSAQCYKTSQLNQCQIIMPNYILAHDKEMGHYDIALTLEHKSRKERLYEWPVYVTPAHAQQLHLSLEANSYELDFNNSAIIKARLEANGQPVIINEKDFNRYFDVRLNGVILSKAAAGQNVKPAKAGDEDIKKASLGPISKIADGVYQFRLLAGNIEELADIYFAYAEIASANIQIAIKDANRPAKAQLNIPRDRVMLKQDQGRPLSLSYYAYSKEGAAISDKDIELALIGEDGKEQKDAAIIELLGKQQDGYGAQITAQKAGIYDLVLRVTDSKGQPLVAAKKRLYFIEAKPSDKSKLTISDKTITFDNSLGMEDQLTVNFEAYDKYGQLINYDKLSDDESLVKNIATRIVGEGFAYSWDVDFIYEGGGRFSWTKSNRDIIEASKSHFYASRYKINLLYKGEELGFSQSVFITPEYSLPDKVEVSPSDAVLYLAEAQTIEINYKLSSRGFIYHPAINPNFAYKLFKDGQDVSDRVKVTPRMDSWSLTITPKDSGDYVIIPYVRDVKDANLWHRIAVGYSTLRVFVFCSNELAQAGLKGEGPLDIDNNKTILTIDKDSLLLDSLNGRSAKISYGAYHKDGTVIAAQNLHLQLEKTGGRKARDAASFSLPSSQGESTTLLMSAQKKGQFQLKLYYNDPKGGSYVIASKDVYFIDGKPSSKSRLSFVPTSVTLDDSAGYSVQSTLLFEAYDAYGHELDYDRLARDDSFIKRIKAQLRNANRQIIGDKELDLQYQGGNRFIWQAKASDILLKDSAGNLGGQYSAQALYDGVSIGLEAQLDIDMSKMFPNNIRVEPKQQKLYLNQNNEAVIDFHFFRDDHLLAYPDAPINFTVLKDGQDTDIRPQIDSPPGSRHHRLRIKLKEPGSYEIRAYCQLFGGALSKKIISKKPIPGASALFDVRLKR